MIVVDTNILVYHCVPGRLTGPALDLAQQEPDWHAPLLWRSEFRNALAGEIRHGLGLERARSAMADAIRRIGMNEHLSDDELVLQLIASSPCSAYDLEFVALAQTLGAPLYTMDRQLLRAFPDLARPLTLA